MVGDIASDLDAARAAGAGAVLVPTVATRWEEVAAATDVSFDLSAVVERVLGEHA
jgi:phosphoglycolate phosphatase-like HAD superfamily hydrolase